LFLSKVHAMESFDPSLKGVSDMIRKLILPLMALALIVWVAGCSKSPTNNKSTDTSSSNQFGGYTTTTETPAFGDAALAANSAGEQIVNDPAVNSPMVDSLQNDTTAGVFHFRAVWGHLRYDSTVTVATDWSGSLTINPRGAIVLRKKIRFEHATDSILPRTSWNNLQWISKTTVYSDGIECDLLIPRPRPTYDTTFIPVVDTLGDTTMTIKIDTIPGTPAKVEFVSGPYSRTFTLSELARLDTVINLNDSVSIAFGAFERTHFGCPRGMLAGSWGADSVSGDYAFKGSWISGFGLLSGFVEGTATTDSMGIKVFYGKWIDSTGEFQGFLRGLWGFQPNYHADSNAVIHAGGWFWGGVYDANANLTGIVKGRFKSGETADAGFFQGRWRTSCMEKGKWDDGMDNGKYEYEGKGGKKK
jgi:hypothetical protein